MSPAHDDEVLRRFARVCAVEGDELELLIEPGPCVGCADGCGGRCNVFAPTQTRLHLPQPAGRCEVGQRVCLHLDRRELRRAAFAGYGLALLGMLVGAGAGALVARVLALSGDVAVAVGLFAGLALAVRALARRTVNPHISHPSGCGR